MIKKMIKKMISKLKNYGKPGGGNALRIEEGNCLDLGVSHITNTTIVVEGKNNTIHVDDSARLSACHINIAGDNNTIFIGKQSLICNAELWIEDDNNSIIMGEHLYIAGKTHLAACEGTRIMIGDDCMFSSEIHFATTDSHSITTMDGKRINPAKDIIIGNHCWIGTRVTCLKGTELAENCVVGAGSLLAGKYCTPNCAWGGNPAKLLKQDINWCRERI